MFKKSVYRNHQQQPILLNKIQSSYRKLEKAMKEPAREYEVIKKLVEDARGAPNQRFGDTRGAPNQRFGENDIEILNKKSKNDIKLTPHQMKNNIKSKK